MQPRTVSDPEVGAELQTALPHRGAQLDHHLGLAREAGQHLLELGQDRGGQRRGVEPEAQGVRPDRPARGLLGGRRHLLGRRLEALDLLHDDARGFPVLVVDPAADEHDRVGGQLLAGGAQHVAEHEQLDRGLEVVERGEHHRIALLGPDRLVLGDHPADGHPVSVAPAGQLRQRAFHPGVERRPDLLERMGRDEQPDRLLLGGQQLGPVELDRPGSVRGWGSRTPPPPLVAALGRAGRTRDRRSIPARSARPAGPSAPRPEPARASSACPCASRPSSRTRRT